MKDYDKGYLDGACSSLIKTIKLIEATLYNPLTKSSSPRDTLHEAIKMLVDDWTQYGFYLGHREAYRAQRDSGEIPATLTFSESDWELIEGMKINLELKSRIKRT